jgi:DNA-binding protein H-NS
MPKQSIRTIQEQIKKLQAKAEALKAKTKKPTIASIVKMMRTNDISIAEVQAALGKNLEPSRGGSKSVRAKPAKSTKPVAIKYKNPETNETWTGRGRTPRWIAEAEAAGKDRQQFAV